MPKLKEHHIKRMHWGILLFLTTIFLLMLTPLHHKIGYHEISISKGYSVVISGK